MIEFDLGKTRKTGELIKLNYHTVWVRLADGMIIKRHNIKHNVDEAG